MNKAMILSSSAMLLCGAGLVYLALFWTPGAIEKPRPNVVLIVIDTLRADRIHATRNGKEVMPNLAALANEGAEFTHAVAQCSWTRPSMASLFTGAYVDTHQVYYGVEQENAENPTSDLLPENWVTLPEHLANNGYDNYAFVTNANLSYPMGFGQGFSPQRYIFGNNAPADAVSDFTLKALPDLKPPFFIYTHYMDPHATYDPPQNMLDTFGGPPEILPEDAAVFENFMDYYMECANFMLGIGAERKYADLSARGKERVWHLYDLECHFADKNVGRLIRNIREKHPDTYFVITADHGEEFWERGGMGHGTSLYEEQIRVPLIMAGPGISPVKISRMTETTGLCPTLGNKLSIPKLLTWQGKDWFDPKAKNDAPVFARSLGSWKQQNVDLEAAWVERLKSIRNNTRATVEVYDLEKDPGEKNNLAASHVEAAEAGKKLLDNHRAGNIKMRGADKVRVQQELSEETKERLKSLGYFEDEK